MINDWIKLIVPQYTTEDGKKFSESECAALTKVDIGVSFLHSNHDNSINVCIDNKQTLKLDKDICVAILKKVLADETMSNKG